MLCSHSYSLLSSVLLSVLCTTVRPLYYCPLYYCALYYTRACLGGVVKKRDAHEPYCSCSQSQLQLEF